MLKTVTELKTELEENQWLLELCFLADKTKKLNELNLKLQGGLPTVFYFKGQSFN